MRLEGNPAGQFSYHRISEFVNVPRLNSFPLPLASENDKMERFRTAQYFAIHEVLG